MNTLPNIDTFSNIVAGEMDYYKKIADQIPENVWKEMSDNMMKPVKTNYSTVKATFKEDYIASGAYEGRVMRGTPSPTKSFKKGDSIEILPKYGGSTVKYRLPGVIYQIPYKVLSFDEKKESSQSNTNDSPSTSNSTSSSSGAGMNYVKIGLIAVAVIAAYKIFS